jgi:hypothetical protein
MNRFFAIGILSNILFFGSSHIDAYSLREISNENIANHQQVICKQLQRNSYLRYLIGIGALVASGYTLSYMFASPTPASPISSDEAATLLADIRSAAKELAGLRERKGEWFSDMKHLLWSTIFFNVVGVLVTNTMNPIVKYFKVLDEKMEKLSNKIFYTPSIEWYVNTHCPIMKAFELMENDINRDQSSNPAYNDIIINDWTLCVELIESLLGFMQYAIKLDADKPTLQQRKHSVQDALIDAVNQQRILMENQLAHNQRVTQITSLVQQISQVIFQFSLLESLDID